MILTEQQRVAIGNSRKLISDLNLSKMEAGIARELAIHISEFVGEEMMAVARARRVVCDTTPIRGVSVVEAALALSLQMCRDTEPT